MLTQAHHPHQISLLMPGALYDSRSCFIRIYCRDENVTSILFEKCGTRTGIQYYEYDYKNVKVIQHDIKSLDNKIDSLNIKCEEVLSAEVVSKTLSEIISEKIGDVSEIPERLEHVLNILKHRKIYPNVSSSKKNETPLSEQFSFALNQLNSGIICVYDRTINLSTHGKGNGFLGHGCMRAIAKALKSGSCRNLGNVTILLDINRLHYDETKSILTSAINSPNCPPGLQIKMRSPSGKKTKSFLKEEVLATENSIQIEDRFKMFLIFKCFPLNTIPLPLAIICVIFGKIEKINMMNFKYPRTVKFTQSILFFNKYFLTEERQQSSKKFKDFYQGLYKSVSKNLDKQFQNWPSIRSAMKNEIKVIFTEIFTELSGAQRKILLDRMNENTGFGLKFAEEIAGKFKNKSLKHLKASGIAGVYCRYLPIKQLYIHNEIKANLIIQGNKPVEFKLNDGEQGAQERRKEVTLQFYKLIAKNADSSQIQFLMKESKPLLIEENKYKNLIIENLLKHSQVEILSKWPQKMDNHVLYLVTTPEKFEVHTSIENEPKPLTWLQRSELEKRSEFEKSGVNFNNEPTIVKPEQVSAIVSSTIASVCNQENIYQLYSDYLQEINTTKKLNEITRKNYFM